MRNLSVIKGLYQGNGVTRRWAIPFEYNDTAQIFVTITTYDEGDYTYRVLDSTEYTIDEDSVEIVYPKTDDDAPIPSTQYLTVWRDTDLLQLMDLTNQGAAWPDSIEASLDKLHQIVQELAEGLSRSLKVDIGDPQTPDEKLVAIQDYVLAAAESSRSAATSEASAQRAAEAAATSAANASESERLAGGYADTASDAASRAEDSAISARAYNAPDYDNAKTYQAGDVVTFTDGNSYRALQETTGNEPPNIIYWQKVTDYVGDDFFEVDEYGYIVPMDSPSHSRYWRVDQNGYIVPIEGGDGGYRPDTRSLSAEYLNVTNEGYIKHLRADDVNAGNVTAGMVTTPQVNVNALTANAVNAQSASVGTLTADKIIATDLMLYDKLDLQISPIVSLIANGDFKRTQGMCMAGDYIIECHYAGDNVANRLYVLNPKTKAVESYADILTGHCNSLCYDETNGYVYAAHAEIGDYRLFKIKLTGTTLSLESTLTVSQPVSAMSWNNGVFYCRMGMDTETTHRPIYTSTDLINFTYIFDADGEVDSSPQGLHVDDNFIYYPISGDDNVERIFVFDKNSHRKINCYEIPRYAYGEIEDIATYNGNILLNFNKHDTNEAVIYLTPLYKNAKMYPNPVKAGDGGLYYGSKSFVLNVDNSQTVAFPDGTTTYPFNSVNLALQCVNVLGLQCVLNVSGTYSKIVVEKQKLNVTITFNNATITDVFDIINSSVYCNGTANIGRIRATGGVLRVGGNSSDDIKLVNNGSLGYGVLCINSIIHGNFTSIDTYNTRPLYAPTGFLSVICSSFNPNMQAYKGYNIVVNGKTAVINREITANSNLNNYKDPGMQYACYTDANAATLSNCPTSNLFTMQILTFGDFGFQEIIDDDGNIYTRRFDASQFYSWKKLTATSIS